MQTTLNKIRQHSPCANGWKKLLAHLGKTQADDEPVSIATVIESNGFDDALWCLRAVEGRDREIRMYAVWCARQVQHLMTDDRCAIAGCAGRCRAFRKRRSERRRTGFRMGCRTGCRIGCRIGCRRGCRTGCRRGCRTGCRRGCRRGCPKKQTPRNLRRVHLTNTLASKAVSTTPVRSVHHAESNS